MTDKRIIKTYVWDGDKCFFVSTIERDSSAPYGGRYNETIAWEYDYEKKERGKMIAMGEDGRGSIVTHQRMVFALQRTGKPPEGEEY